MDLNLAGKVAVVTGASRGIGLAITQALAGEGVRVVAGARELTTDIVELAQHHQVRPEQIDLTTPGGPGRLIDAAVSSFGGLDIVVNNVGAVTPRTSGFLSITDEDWANTLTINLLTAVRTIRAALPHLITRGGGNIITIASINATLPDPLVIDYSAAKAALLNVSKALSKEYGSRGIRINTVSPGPVSTALWLGDQGVAATLGQAQGIDPAAVAERAAADAVTGRFTRPEEVADLVLLLASERASNITGADILIDGGMKPTL
ncbi:SDR family oxidoreductase [Micromonospora sp. NBC_01699]|uniref:SDR family NAD(P)-dependent oxidoreductase n=1 Tax=Micromonospora sp. NBC_01699 TaxID=2975984 RepID=UPI002E2957ED|nr:SDR family oxidoreductase [Micromonospora sp. NBC_01699]